MKKQCGICDWETPHTHTQLGKHNIARNDNGQTRISPDYGAPIDLGDTNIVLDPALSAEAVEQVREIVREEIAAYDRGVNQYLYDRLAELRSKFPLFFGGQP